MHYRAEDLSRKIGSRIWSTIISPRPVFMIVTCSTEGLFNIAPYSSVSLISNYPPLVGISFGRRRGQLKNTLTNILATREFSLNVVPRSLSGIANRAAEGVDVSEDFERLGLSPRRFVHSSAVAIAESPASVACVLSQEVTLEVDNISLIVARCEEILLDDEFTEGGVFDSVKANLIASVDAEEYITVKGETFTQPRTWE